jgi:hypothetical protein
MWRRILLWFSPLLVALICLVPSAAAQSKSQDKKSGEGGGDEKTPAFAYTVAFLSTIVVMVLVCAPSRKR